MIEENDKFLLAKEYVNKTSINIFLTGKAGTGKTTFLKEIVNNSIKRLIVTAPTGIAAINAGGVTLHSFFQLPFGLCLPDYKQIEGFKKDRRVKFNKSRLKIIRSLELLIIDEISMLRADLLDEIDAVLRRIRRNFSPFGGVQLLMIGDMHQLPPVVKDEDWELMKNYYDSPYFFDSKVLKTHPYAKIEFDKIYRQRDLEFINILEAVRENKLTNDIISRLNSRWNPDVEVEDGSIILATHNKIADSVNEKKLEDLNSKLYTYEAKIVNDFPENLYPLNPILRLKKGAQVMFTKNDTDPSRRYVNGTLAKVLYLDNDTIEVLTDRGEKITVETSYWENLKYSIDDQTKEIVSDIDGFFYHYPLKLAWAITIHKSQGLTFDKAIIDAGASFSHGQVYVALSRCRTLEGMTLRTKLSYSSIITDFTIKQYSADVSSSSPSKEKLKEDCRAFFLDQVREVFDLSRLSRLFFQLKRFADTAAVNLYPKAVEFMSSSVDGLNNDLFSVAKRFDNTLIKIISDDYQTNDHLQERVCKASNYFSDKLIELIFPIIEYVSRFSFDGKNEAKLYSSFYSNLLEEVAMKSYLWEYTKNGFKLDAFLKQKAKIIVEISDLDSKKLWRKLCPKSMENDKSVTRKTAGGEKANDKEDILNNELFESLRAWRNEKAKSLELPAYCIAHQRVLISIANTPPTNKSELLAIKGVGKTFIEKYGEEILNICE